MQPEITKEEKLWNQIKHEYLLEKNNNIPVDTYKPSSFTKVWFKCENNHEYENSFKNRCYYNHKCPDCKSHKVDDDKCITTTHPEIAKEYHPTKNTIPIDHLDAKSMLSIWWQCLKDPTHEYETTVKSRAIRKTSCIHCNGKTTANGNTLQEKFPLIAKEWHLTKNLITPLEITPKSDKKAWFTCSKNHDYETLISTRTRNNTGCPYCANKKVLVDNSFKVLHPEIANEWDYDKNEKKPEEYKSQSNCYAFWKCKQNHEWQAYISNRTKGHGCPYCLGHKINKENCILVTHPNVAKEYHPTKNEISIEELSAGSNKICAWICSKDNTHEWKTTVNSRALKGSGCPHCNGKTTANNNTLLEKFPDVAKELHPTKNSFKADEITPKSDVRAWFICNNNHEYETKISSRTSHDTGCPFCAGKKVADNTSFKTHHPTIAKEWNYEKNEKKPEEYSRCSGKDVWWTCEKEHEWKSSISNRIKGHGCPYCSNRKACIENNFADKHPELLKEWHPTKNLKKPEKCTPSSHDKVWWKCKKGHEWEAKIANRTIGNKSNCPTCNLSKLELLTKETLYKLNRKYKQQYIFDDLKNHRFDFYVYKKNTLIECDGVQHFDEKSKFYKCFNRRSFNKQVESDLQKNEYAKLNNINLIRIAYTEHKNIDEILTNYFENKLYKNPNIYYYPEKLYNKPSVKTIEI